MNPLTREWIEKAEEDYRSAMRLLRARKDPTHNVVCFHAQQCAEKYMKAVLQEAQVTFAYNHSLPALLDQLKLLNPMWDAERQAATSLNDFAVRFRYPGKHATKLMAKNAMLACGRIRTTMRQYFGLGIIRKKTSKRKRTKKSK